MPRLDGEERVAGAVRWVAFVGACVMVIALPVLYILFGIHLVRTALETEVKHLAGEISKFIGANPLSWRFESSRLEFLLERHLSHGAPKTLIIRDRENRTVAELRAEFGPPVLRQYGPVTDFGLPVGTVEVQVSLRPLLLNTGLVSFAGFFVGLLVYFPLRSIPLRALRHATADLAREKAYSDNIVDTMSNALLVLSPDGRIEKVNRAGLDLLGYRLEDIVGQPSDLVFGLQGSSFVAEVTAGHPVSNRERLLMAKSGIRIPVLLSSAVLRNRDGKPEGVVCIATDITERRRAEIALADRSEALERSNDDLRKFAYVASHDLREPLRMVGSYMDMLELKYADRLDDRARQYIGFAVEGAKRMDALIRDLLRYSQVHTHGDSFQDLESEEVLVEVLENLGLIVAESGACVAYRDLPRVYADRAQLLQLFQNLVGNALKYRAPDRPPEVLVAAEVSEDAATFRVQDNGIGIDSRFHQRIFQIFQRLHRREEYAGTGVGLALCHRIVERHGGRIWLESTPGEGTTFFFTLSTAPPPD